MGIRTTTEEKSPSKKKMKLSIIASVSAFTTDNRTAREVAEEKGEKRYAQLVDMMKHYNSEFDERKYWTYGCHCLMLGDRPMSDMGKGRPIDALDTACKAWKHCQKCAREAYGEMCIGEFVRYNFGYSNGEAVCRNGADTCKRSLCECDALFAKVHSTAKDVWDQDYHMFWSTTTPQWNAEGTNSCQAGSPGSADFQCCRNDAKTSPYIWYNAQGNQCCSDGSVVQDGQFC